MTTHEIQPLVASVLEGGDASELLASLMKMNREDINGQAAIRVLMVKDCWDFTPKNEHDAAMEHLFGAFEDRGRQSSEDYLRSTQKIILDLWGVEVESPQWHVIAPVVNKKVKTKEEPRATTEAKKTTRKKVTPVPSDKQIHATSSDLDGASDRLKKVIKIQRGG